MIYRDCIYILFTVFAFCFLPSFHSRMKWMESQSHQRRKRWEQMKERKNLTFTQRGHPPPIALMSSVETTGSDYCPWTAFLKTLFCGWNAIRGPWFGSSREVAFPLQWHITGTHRLSVRGTQQFAHPRTHFAICRHRIQPSCGQRVASNLSSDWIQPRNWSLYTQMEYGFPTQDISMLFRLLTQWQCNEIDANAYVRNSKQWTKRVHCAHTMSFYSCYT